MDALWIIAYIISLRILLTDQLIINEKNRALAYFHLGMLWGCIAKFLVGRRCRGWEPQTYVPKHSHK